MFPSTPVVADDDDRRPWDPPFDASKPAPPISYPITTLAALASGDYLSEAHNFHLPFNRASTPLLHSAAPLPARPRILACHDFKGGYRDDAAPQGGNDPGAYALWHWHLIDIFVYFSHDLVTLPPPCWINAGHLHGVKGYGYQVSVEGLKVSSDPWNNISCQSFQVVVVEADEDVGGDCELHVGEGEEPLGGDGVNSGVGFDGDGGIEGGEQDCLGRDGDGIIGGDRVGIDGTVGGEDEASDGEGQLGSAETWTLTGATKTLGA
ncbi:hypothetical protein ABZP36_029244 [Zizania latifolia]